jgi:hypothetical protein
MENQEAKDGAGCPNLKFVSGSDTDYNTADYYCEKCNKHVFFMFGIVGGNVGGKCLNVKEKKIEQS